MANKFLDLQGLQYFWGKIKPSIDSKVEKVDGKGLSTNDFTNELKTKLEGLQNTVVDAALDKNSANAVANKAVAAAIEELNNGKVSTGRKINGHDLTADVNLTAEDVAAVPAAKVGVAGGVASLDEAGKVPAAQLPSYVDDVIEGTLATFGAGEAGKIYVDTETGKTYRWSGSQYVEISASLALGETSSTAFRGDLGKVAYEHSQVAHAPADAQKNVQADWNVSDTASDAFIMNKPTSLPANGGNADTVGGFTVGVNVPADAKFTDTTYEALTNAEIDTIFA